MKSFIIRVLASAVADLDEAFEYYSDISPKLGQRFIKLVNASLNDLKKNPHYQIRYDNFRTMPTGQAGENYKEVSLYHSLYPR